MTELKEIWLNAPVIAVLVFGLVMAVFGAKCGFMKMVLSMLSVVIAVTVVWLFSANVKDWVIDNTSADEQVESKLREVIGSPQESFEKTLEGLHLPDAVISMIAEKTEGSSGDLPVILANYIITAAVNVLLFFLTLILLKILIHATDILTKLPVLKQLNGFLGLVLGLLEAWVILNIIFLLLTTLIQAPWGADVLSRIRKNPLTEWLYQHNFLLKTVK